MVQPFDLWFIVVHICCSLDSRSNPRGTLSGLSLSPLGAARPNFPTCGHTLHGPTRASISFLSLLPIYPSGLVFSDSIASPSGELSTRAGGVHTDVVTSVGFQVSFQTRPRASPTPSQPSIQNASNDSLLRWRLRVSCAPVNLIRLSFGDRFPPRRLFVAED